MSNKILNDSSGNSGEEYQYFKRELQEQLENINNVSSLPKHGTDGICNRVKDLLSGMDVEDTIKECYSIEELPLHESEDDDDEELDIDENLSILSKKEDKDAPDRAEINEKRIRYIEPFFTVINADNPEDSKYKEMNQNTLNRKKVSLVALERKIEKRNDFLNKFGKVYTITNLS